MIYGLRYFKTFFFSCLMLTFSIWIYALLLYLWHQCGGGSILNSRKTVFVRELKHFNNFFCILRTMIARVIEILVLLSFNLLLLCFSRIPFNSGSQIINKKIELLCLLQSVLSILCSKIRNLSSLKKAGLKFISLIKKIIFIFCQLIELNNLIFLLRRNLS